MDLAQEALFGDFPRAIGVTIPRFEGLRQFLIHSEAEFDSIVEKASGKRNLYSSISTYVPSVRDGKFEGCAVKSDSVSFDFDSSAKAPPEAERRWSSPIIPDEADDGEVEKMMREDAGVLDEVLGDVCHDASQLAEYAIQEGIPSMGVFSGLGIHYHLLYEPTMSRPGDKLDSTCKKLTAELGLSTADIKASGKPFRIMRIPNCRRRNTGIYTVPLRAAEMADIGPRELLDLSATPRPEIAPEASQRPQLKVHEDWLGPQGETVEQERMRPIPDGGPGEPFSKLLVEKICRMPCVYEHAIGRNPPNDVRVKLGIMLLNAGYSPVEATRIIRGLNWADFDFEVTKYQLERLQDSGKGDWSCETMQRKGLCTRADDPSRCPTVGYQGGNQPWKT